MSGVPAPSVDLETLQELLRRRSGFALGADRAYLIESRLGALARREGAKSGAQLLADLDEAARPSLAWDVVEAMLPVDSSFFRDGEPFRLFAEGLGPVLAAARPDGRVRVLSAGCAAGQEPYSLAIAAAEEGLTGVEIDAVDLSSRALHKAKEGAYTSFEIQRGLTARRMIRWFERADDLWRPNETLRQAVRFDRRNLLDGPKAAAPYDVIFCRYVLSDMTGEARRRVLTLLEAALAPGGCLFLGADERLAEAQEAFRPVAGKAGLYVKNPTRLNRAA